MAESNKTNALITLMVETLKLAPKLQHEGDKLTSEFDLTSSRWGVLGFLSMADKPLTVADLARRMHLKPQTVQRFVTALQQKDFIELSNNPDHKTAKLLSLTRKGEKALVKLKEKEQRWAASISKGLSNKDINTAAKVLSLLQENINEP